MRRSHRPMVRRVNDQSVRQSRHPFDDEAEDAVVLADRQQAVAGRLAEAGKSLRAPGSVASTVRVSPTAMALIALRARRTGSGHCKPLVSKGWSVMNGMLSHLETGVIGR